MSPQWLPESILFVASLFAAGIALHLLITGERRRGAAMSVASVALLFLAVLLTRVELSRLHRPAPTPDRFLTPAGVDPRDDDPRAGTRLRLGDSILYVAPSKRYVLSADGKRFLTLSVEKRGLTVSCRLADSRDQPGARIRRNRLWRRPGDPIYIDQIDPHTLAVGESGRNHVLRIRYATPREILVTGRFHHASLAEPVVISSGGGFRWHGGGVPPGMSIDLTHFGPGVIDLERSGLIRVLPGADPLLPSVASLCGFLLRQAAFFRI